MTVKEEISKFTHEVEEVLHDVEEVFHDVKEHMLLSVRDFSIQIAFVLMGITSAILVIGTVYVWCFHHPKRPHAEDSGHEEQLDDSEISDVPHLEKMDSAENERTSIGQKTDEPKQEVIEKVGKEMKVETEKSEQNGQVRKRTTSSSLNNNNNSPVKSKIPVRQKSRNSSS